MLCLDTTFRVTLHDIAGRSKKEGNGRRKGEMIPFIFLGIRRNSILWNRNLFKGIVSEFYGVIQKCASFENWKALCLRQILAVLKSVSSNKYNTPAGHKSWDNAQPNPTDRGGFYLGFWCQEPRFRWSCCLPTTLRNRVNSPVPTLLVSEHCIKFELIRNKSKLTSITRSRNVFLCGGGYCSHENK